jgi:hypothetical protein
MVTERVLKSHIFRKSGSCKTVCVSSVLHAIGIAVTSYHSTSTPKNMNNYECIIRNHGYALRSRKSHMREAKTVGAIRSKIRALKDPEGTRYLVRLKDHVLLLDSAGKTIVDTDRRVRDKRQVVRVQAIWKM